MLSPLLGWQPCSHPAWSCLGTLILKTVYVQEDIWGYQERSRHACYGVVVGSSWHTKSWIPQILGFSKKKTVVILALCHDVHYPSVLWMVRLWISASFWAEKSCGDLPCVVYNDIFVVLAGAQLFLSSVHRSTSSLGTSSVLLAWEFLKRLPTSYKPSVHP